MALAARAAALRQRKPKPSAAPVERPAPPALVARVKCLMSEHGQMASDAWRRAWTTKGGGRGPDPSVYSAEFLAKFVEEVGEMAGRAASLVTQVKQLQGRCSAAAVAWEQHCRRTGQMDPDPRKQNAMQLQEFLEFWEKDGASMPSAELVSQVRSLTKTSPEAKAKWNQWFKRQGGQWSPNMHTRESLESFLRQMGQSSSEAEDLTGKVEEFLEDETNLLAWSAMCRKENKPHDPKQCEESFLRSFLEMCECQQEARPLKRHKGDGTAMALWVQNLPHHATAADLEDHFSIYGKAINAQVRGSEGRLTLVPELTEDAVQLMGVIMEHTHRIQGEQVLVRAMLEKSG
ncbi:unnamed protein product [Effrenium voratum]|uniref:RRM domain-containing protein n=1 Tax=Effrenium voratum TaxID=2562239 RepID=A0AA36NB59_9DINO|nr:unnamed protein product [Effrenium voratum]CAJ1399484.1 unnamed protein product [Effrenium voratum]CAJ1419932.1 unnamed protein product [Effrenium voratum]